MGEITAQELDPRDRKRFENALLAKERGNPEYAIDICLDLLSLEPGCLEARELLRRSQHARFATRNAPLSRAAGAFVCSFVVARGRAALLRDSKRAMDLGERALCANPFHRGALRLVAAAATRLELFNTAVFCMRGLVESYPNDLGALFAYCEALIKAGATDHAIAAADRLSKLKPESARIQELAKAASVAHSINKGKWADKGGDFRGKLRNREDSERLEREGRLTTSASQSGARQEDLLAAVQRNPQDLESYKKLVRLHVERDDYASALIWLNRAFLLPQAEGDVYLRQLRSDLTMKRLEVEIEALRGKASANTPERIQEMERQLADLRLEEAGKLVEQFPNDYGQRLKYGEFLLDAGRLDEAVQQFQVSQRSPNLKARSLVALGRSFMAKGLFDLALEQLDLAIKDSKAMDAFRKDTLYLSAKCCERLERHVDAIARYKLIYASDIGYRDVAAKVDAYYSGGDG